MAFSRPSRVDPNHLHENGKLYSDALIENITKTLDKQAPGNRFVPRTKVNVPGAIKKAPFSVTRMDGEIYAIYYGKKQGKHLGEGAFGKVKLAQNLKTGEWVAMKMTRTYTDDLKKEVAINKLLGTAHSNLHFRPTKRKNQFKYEFMVSLAHGEEMANIFVPSNNPAAHAITFDERMRAALQVLREFESMHQKGVLHCDVKLENMFYDKKTDKVTILDFGLSNFMDQNGEARTGYRGSPFSTPPEISIRKAQNVFSAKTDTFGVGVALADIFGLKLRENPATVEMTAYHRNADYLPIKPRDFNDEIEKQIIVLINSMLSQDPAQRPTLSTVLVELSKMLTPEIVINGKVTINERPPSAEMTSAMLINLLRANLLEMATVEYHRITKNGENIPPGDHKIQALANLIAALKDDKVAINEISIYAHQYKQASLAKQNAASRFFHKSSKADKFLDKFEKLFTSDMQKINDRLQVEQPRTLTGGRGYGG